MNDSLNNIYNDETQNKAKIQRTYRCLVGIVGCLHIFGHILYLMYMYKKIIQFLTRESTDNGPRLSSLADSALAAPQRQNVRQDV